MWSEQLPVFDFAGSWLLRSNHLVAVEQTKRIKGQFQLSAHGKLVFAAMARRRVFQTYSAHRIHRSLA